MSFRATVQLTMAGLLTNDIFFMVSFVHVKTVSCVTYSLHASDIVILPCESCRSPCRACSKRCVKSWYLVMMASEFMLWNLLPPLLRVDKRSTLPVGKFYTSSYCIAKQANLFKFNYQINANSFPS